MSLLLSNHLHPLHREGAPKRSVSLKENYFTHPALHRSIESAAVRFDPLSFYTQWHLFIDEGFDTLRLFGLSLPFHLFSEAGMLDFFFHSKCIFLYNEVEEAEKGSTDSFQSILYFIRQHKEQCFVLNSKFLIAHPLHVLQQLTLFISSKLVDSNKVLPHTDILARLMKNSIKRRLSDTEKAGFHALEYMAERNTRLTGNDLLVILWGASDKNSKLLLSRLKDIYCSFLEPVSFILIADNKNDLPILQETMLELSDLFPDVQVRPRTGSRATQLNSLIEQSDKQFFFVDDLSTNYSCADLLLSGQQKKQDVLAFAKVSTAIEVTKANLSDLLVKDYPEHNLFFFKTNLAFYQSL
ncbi:hypothetical protein EMGBS15_01640 [Filimonas sp.]|nr:hypothetical protein EMGBS15_01640 [Filimonas sp.]